MVPPVDGLDHLDGDGLVVDALEVAVVLQTDVDPVSQAGVAHPLSGLLVLGGGDRGRGDPAPVVPGGVDGETAPAGADLHDVVLGAEGQLGAQPVQLGLLGALQILAGVVEHGGGVGHRRVEEGGEEVVAEVVVHAHEARRATGRLPGDAAALHDEHAGALAGEMEGEAGALDARPDDYENKRFSDRHYKFVNAVARELAQTHPGKYVGTLCYHIARELPETVDRLEPNVFISMTQRVGEWWRPGQRDDDIALTHAWRERCSHMSRYGYIGLGFLTPRVFPHAMAEGMKLDHSLGFEAVYNECYTILPNVAPMMYMMARLQWDTDLDPDALLDEFYARMFGEAAVTMKACYDTLERSYMEPRPDRLELARWGHRHLLTHSLALSEEALDQAEALMAQALAEADTPEARARIEIVGASLQYAGYIIRAGSWARAMAGEEISTAEQAQAVLDRLERLIALSEEREQFWAAALERDDLLGDSLRGLKQRGYFVVNQISEVEAPASACLGQALTVLYAHAPEAASATIARIAASGPNPLAEQAAGWLVELRGEAPNLLKNAGFQEWAASAPLPADWSSWSRTGGARFIRGEERGRDGSTAAAIARADGACYMQHVPVTPGQKYLCSVWASCDTPGAATAAALGVRWQTGDGAWHPDRECEPRTALTVRGGRWERLSVIATVPDGAARLVFMLTAEGQTGEHAVVFDDAAVLQLSE